MKTFAFTLLALPILLLGCKTDVLPAGTPECLQMKIDEFESQTIRNPPASIWLYKYGNQYVYYIPPYCCDMFGELYDTNCDLICYPDGGITGGGDGNCPEFHNEATKIKLVWQDKRE